MAIEVLLLIKILIIAIVALFHSLQGRHFKAVLLAALLYAFIPGFDDFIVQPALNKGMDMVAGFDVPMWLSMLIYFGIGWIIIALVFLFL